MEARRSTRAAALALLLPAGCDSPPATSPPAALACGATLDYDLADQVAATQPLAHVRSWQYVLDRSAGASGIARLAQSRADLVVIDDPRTLADSTNRDGAAEVKRLHDTTGAAGRRKLVLAYVNVGEAESTRRYWQPGWTVGAPDFILATDPDGWSGDYPVAYWRDAWKSLLYGRPDALVDIALSDGYDGVYLDWVEAFEFDPVVAQAQAEGLAAPTEMVSLVKQLRSYARGVRPGFLVVAQNGSRLGKRPEWLALLDGQAEEDVFFDGAADVHGRDPRQGDCRLPLHTGDPPPADNPSYCAGLSSLDASSEDYVKALAGYLLAGVPVLTVDYALKADHAACAYRQAARLHFVELVTMRSLEDLTATPPP